MTDVKAPSLTVLGVVLLYVAEVDAAVDAQSLAEDCSHDSGSQLPSDLIFDAVAAALPDAGSADELRERSDPRYVLNNNNNTDS